MKSKEEILDLLGEFGLSRIRDVLESLLLPAVRINLHQVCDPMYYHPPSMTLMFVNDVRVYPPVPTAPAFDTLPIGASKIGGYPDLPADFVWPYHEQGEPLEFFAQLNFAEVADVTPLDSLPITGFLSIFIGMDLSSCYVLHYQGEIFDLVRNKAAEEFSQFGSDEFFPPYSMSFEQEWTVPSVDTAYETRSFNLSQEEQYAYYEFSDRIRRRKKETSDPIDQDRGYHHHLLGWDDMYMGGRAECADRSSSNPVLNSVNNWDKETWAEVYGRLAEEGKQWQTLLEVNTASFNGNKWDFGWYPCFFIRKEDLIARDFNRVCVLWDKV